MASVGPVGKTARETIGISVEKFRFLGEKLVSKKCPYWVKNGKTAKKPVKTE